MHLASSRNTFNLEAAAVREGDVLVKRWQKVGTGHVLIVKEVQDLTDGHIEANLVSGSMPRRQPKWENSVSSKNYFTAAATGGEGTNPDDDEFVKLGGGLKRFRVTKNIGGYWTNTWMAADEASWISDTDYDALKVRPATFGSLLGDVSPEQKRDALLAVIEDNRHHLREYPASCSARERREGAFKDLLALMSSEFNMDRAAVEAQYRSLEDYVFAELEYGASKTCCWNSTTHAMFQIVMEYNELLQQDGCSEPVVFRASGGGYDIFESYATQTGRGHLWKPWTEDELCEQRDTIDDVIKPSGAAGWCGLGEAGGGADAGCIDDAYEDNDNLASATPLPSAASGLMVCNGDSDYFSFSVLAGRSATVRISFSHAEGDLDMKLYQGGSEIDSSTTTNDSESIQLSSGDYVVRVAGYMSAEASYDIDLSLH
jgi:hypothetical protein